MQIGARMFAPTNPKTIPLAASLFLLGFGMGPALVILAAALALNESVANPRIVIYELTSKIPESSDPPVAILTLNCRTAITQTGARPAGVRPSSPRHIDMRVSASDPSTPSNQRQQHAIIPNGDRVADRHRVRAAQATDR